MAGQVSGAERIGRRMFFAGLVVAGLAVMLALVLWVAPVSADGESCGSLIAPTGSDRVGFEGFFQDAVCADARDARQGQLLAVVAVGVAAAGLGGFGWWTGRHTDDT